MKVDFALSSLGLEIRGGAAEAKRFGTLLAHCVFCLLLARLINMLMWGSGVFSSVSFRTLQDSRMLVA